MPEPPPITELLTQMTQVMTQKIHKNMPIFPWHERHNETTMLWWQSQWQDSQGQAEKVNEEYNNFPSLDVRHATFEQSVVNYG